MEFLKSSDEILGVGEFSRRFKMLVKTEVPELWLRGEISNLKTYSSGHQYFTIKDFEGSISAVLFKGFSRGVSFPLKEGMKILAYGEISVYEARGVYQMVLKAALPDGLGDLNRRFEELKKKLSEEGLFDKSRKRSIPPLPKNVAVVTSPSGAAIADFCRILARRGWGGNVWILPSKVQGDEAAAEICGQIKFAQNFVARNGEGFDLLVVMRGGGSLEDLWPFNEESVARALADSNIPTISAVGHEIDFSLTDFVADLRTETPSAAAEFISSSRIEAEGRLKEVSSAISKEAAFAIGSLREKLDAYVGRLRLNSPLSKLSLMEMSLDETESRITSVCVSKLSALTKSFADVEKRYSAVQPASKLELYSQKLESLSKQLWLLGAESALKRGYALLADAEGNLLSSVSQISAGETFSARLCDGRIVARADSVEAGRKSRVGKSKIAK